MTEAGADDEGMKITDAKITRSLGTTDGQKLSERFLFAQRALSGEFTPSDESADTETGTGLLDGLVNFPTELEFTVVAERADATEQELLRELSEIAVDAGGLMPTRVAAKPRGTRFTSVRMSILVGSPLTKRELHRAFAAHPAVKFTF
jgi:putative lipoic acid-binding regulatory protein